MNTHFNRAGQTGIKAVCLRLSLAAFAIAGLHVDLSRAADTEPSQQPAPPESKKPGFFSPETWFGGNCKWWCVEPSAAEPPSGVTERPVAQEGTTPSVAGAEPATSSPKPERRGFALYVLGGLFRGNDNPQLSNLDEHEVLGLGLEYRFNKNFAIGVEGSVWLREYDQPPLIQPTPGVVYPPPIDFISEGVLLTVRAIYPASNTEWYVGAGLGRFGTTLTLCEEWVEYYAPVCREGAKEYVQRDRSISYQLLLGVDWFATQHVYGGVQLRQLFLDADFGDITGGKVDLGGTALVVGLGYAF